MIRPLTASDREQFADLMMEFYEERIKPLGLEMSLDKCLEHFDMYISLPNMVGLAYEKDGKIAGAILVAVSPMLGSNVIIGQEVVWYVSKDHRSCGVRLLKNMEITLRDKGCEHIMMIGLEGDHSCSFYERFGYNLFQKSYIKKVG